MMVVTGGLIGSALRYVIYPQETNKWSEESNGKTIERDMKEDKKTEDADEDNEDTDDADEDDEDTEDADEDDEETEDAEDNEETKNTGKDDGKTNKVDDANKPKPQEKNKGDKEQS